MCSNYFRKSQNCGSFTMDSLKVASNAAASPLATQMMTQLLRGAPRDGKGRPSIDHTDNHDSCGLCPDLPDMRREEERLKTFDRWPVAFLPPDQLARNGFYYIGHGDEVRCAFCKVEIMQWKEGDDPEVDHRRWAPQCPFLRRLAGAAAAPADAGSHAGQDECGARAPAAAEPARMPGPKHPRYASKAARLQSFKDWPRCMRQKPEDLAEAGFFYTGQSDKTKCFYCDGGLKDWEPDDVPWEQHARWFNKCAYVLLVKGCEYVQKVISDAHALSTPDKDSPSPEPSGEERKEDEPREDVDDAKLCKICYAEERNVCFVPCGHVVACAKCALSADKCPMCRRTFSNAVRLYFS